MNKVFMLYRQLIANEDTMNIDINANFIDSLEYLENGIKLIEIMKSFNANDLVVLKGFRSKKLFEDYNKFNTCEFYTASELTNINSESYSLEKLSENTYKIELQ
jgi:uncharacterized protein YktA (UPF0223 family)